jgi:hypothetical protein
MSQFVSFWGGRANNQDEVVSIQLIDSILEGKSRKVNLGRNKMSQTLQFATKHPVVRPLLESVQEKRGWN